MQVLASVREAEVVAAFLRAEINSSRFRPALVEILRRDGVGQAFIELPDLDDPIGNENRRSLLSELRGWGENRGLFTGFPAPVAWCRAAFACSELMDVRYANLDHWHYLSGGSRRPGDAARRLRSGLVPEIDLSFYQAVAYTLSLRTAPQELIMVSNVDGGDLVLVDGHARITALFLADKPALPQLTTFIAFADGLEGWVGY